jgi:NitT/TauT family transport system substrate-binding protein
VKLLNRSYSRLPALVGVLALLIAACGGGRQAGEPADTDTPTQPPAGTETTATETASAAEPEVASVTVTQAVASLAFLPVYVADSQGFFEEEGLQVEQVVTQGGGPDLQALLAGDAEFNAGAGTYQINALREGQDVRNVFNYMNRSIVNVALSTKAAEEAGVTPESSLDEKIEALEGLTLGVTRPGSLTDATARFLVRQAGMDPDADVEIVGVGGGGPLLAALQQGQVDAIVISSPIAETAVAQGEAIMLINNAQGAVEAIDPFMMENIYVRPDFAEQNPNTVAAFVRAVSRATEWSASATPEEVADAVSEAFGGLERDVLVESLRNVLETLNTEGELSQEAVENTLEVLAEEEIDASRVLGTFTDRFLS